MPEIMNLLVIFINIGIITSCIGENIPITSNSLTNSDFIQALERFRINMRSGVGESNTILAPYTNDFIDSDFRVAGVFDFQGPLNNIRIDGLDGFIINSINYNDNTRRLDYTITIPAMISRGLYNLMGRFSGLIPIFGNGNFMLAPLNLRFTGYLQFSVNQQGFVMLADFYSRVTIERLDTVITNLMMGGELGDLVNYIIQDIAPSTMNRRHAFISRDLHDWFTPIANGHLNTMTWDEFVDRIRNYNTLSILCENK